MLCNTMYNNVQKFHAEVGRSSFCPEAPRWGTIFQIVRIHCQRVHWPKDWFELFFLNDDSVLHEAAGRVGLPHGVRVPAAGHPALVQEDLKAGRDSSGAGRQVDTVGVRVEACQ